MKKSILFISALLSLQLMNAQETEVKGKPELVSSEEALNKLMAQEKGEYKYSVEDYFKKPSQSSFQFSPDGKYVSYKQRDEEGKTHVYTKNTETDEIRMVIEEKEELIRGYGWANENRLIYIMDKGGDENYHLFAVDLDGNNQVDLTPFD